MARVLIRPQAAREFLAAATYLAREASPAAVPALGRQDSGADRGDARLGSPWESENPRLAGVRFRPVRGFPRYLVFYQSTADTIEVLRPLHGSRDVENILERE